MSNVDDLIKEINEEIKSYKKYEAKPLKEEVDFGVKGRNKKSWLKKEQIPYFLIPLVVIVILAYFKPKFLYDVNVKDKSKKLNVKKTFMTITILSGITTGLYYFYMQNLF